MARAHVDIAMRWGDQDAYGHINNVAYARYLEETRVRLFWLGAARESTGLDRHFRADDRNEPMMLVAAQQIEFVAVLDYSARPISVEVWVGKLGGSSLELHYEVTEGVASDRRVVARAMTTIVMVDRSSGSPVRLSEEGRASIGPWMDPPLRFRR